MVDKDRLRSLVERIERLEEEKKAIASDIKDIYGEAKVAGYDVPVLRRLIRDRRVEPAKLEEFETLLDVYKRALEGGREDTPIEAAAKNPRVVKAVRELHESAEKNGTTIEISGCGKTVTLGKKKGAKAEGAPA